MERLAESTVEKGSHRTEPMPAGGRECRALILWPHVPHYLAACVRALLVENGVQVLLLAERTDVQANHVPLQAFANFRYVEMSAGDRLSEVDLVRMVRDFAPSLVVAGCSKWGLSLA